MRNLTKAMLGLAGLVSATFAFHVAAQAPTPTATLAASVDPATRVKFDETCAACHGVGGVGGDRAPSLLNNPKLRSLTDEDEWLVSRRERKKVEMLFAHLKRILRLDRLRLRGPCGARDEFHLAAAAQNLRKLAKLIPMTTPAMA